MRHADEFDIGQEVWTVGFSKLTDRECTAAVKAPVRRITAEPGRDGTVRTRYRVNFQDWDEDELLATPEEVEARIASLRERYGNRTFTATVHGT